MKRITGAILLASCTFVSAAEYEINTIRKSKVGDSRRISVRSVVAADTEMFNDGRKTLTIKKKREVIFFGRERVLAVDEEGCSTELWIKVDEISKTEDGKEVNDIPPGSELTVSFVPKPEVFFADGRDPTRNQAKTMGTLFKHQHRGAYDSLLFGTEEKKKPGDKWKPLDLVAAAEIYLKKAEVELKDATSSAEFLGKKSLSDVECLHLRFSLHAKRAKLPMKLPVTMRLKEMDYYIVFDGFYPMDSSKPRMALQVRQKSDIVIKGSRSAGDEGPTLIIKATQFYESKTLSDDL